MRNVVIAFLVGVLSVGAVVLVSERWRLSSVERAWHLFERSDRSGVAVMRGGSAPPQRLVADNRSALDRLVAAGELVQLTLPDDMTEWLIKNDVRLFLPLYQKMGGQRGRNAVYVCRVDEAFVRQQMALRAVP